MFSRYWVYVICLHQIMSDHLILLLSAEAMGGTCVYVNLYVCERMRVQLQTLSIEVRVLQAFDAECAQRAQR